MVSPMLDTGGDVPEETSVRLRQGLGPDGPDLDNRLADDPQCVVEADRERLEPMGRGYLFDQQTHKVGGREQGVGLLLDQVWALGSEEPGTLSGLPGEMPYLDRAIGKLDPPPAVVMAARFPGCDRLIQERGRDPTGTWTEGPKIAMDKWRV